MKILSDVMKTFSYLRTNRTATEYLTEVKARDKLEAESQFENHFPMRQILYVIKKNGSFIITSFPRGGDISG
jgi:hypothetical protein